MVGRWVKQVFTGNLFAHVLCGIMWTQVFYVHFMLCVGNNVWGYGRAHTLVFIFIYFFDQLFIGIVHII